MNHGELRLTTLCENTVAHGGVRAEWGLSIIIEAGSRRILFDTGPGRTTVQNADSMGIDLASVDTVILSHSHADHTGGLLEVLSRIDGECSVIAHPDVWKPKYARHRKSKKYRFCGIPYQRQQVESHGAKFTLSTEPVWITDDIATSGEEPMTTDFESVAEGFFLREGAEYEPDTLKDDLSVCIRTDLGLVVVFGCAHRGMINIIRHCQNLLGTDDVYMVVGGTHLFPASGEQLDRTVQALEEIQPAWIGVSHCTGFAPSAKLAAVFQDRFFLNNAGTVITLPR